MTDVVGSKKNLNCRTGFEPRLLVSIDKITFAAKIEKRFERGYKPPSGGGCWWRLPH